MRMSPMPLEAVVLGAGHCIEHYDALKGSFKTTMLLRGDCY